MTKYFELISDLPMSIEFFVYMGVAFTGLIIAFMILWVHTHKNPAKIEECPEWADPEKWAEDGFLAGQNRQQRLIWILF